MNNFGPRLKHELAELIPPAVFFFISFQILALTQQLMLKGYGIEVTAFLSATVGALIVAKVVLLSDLLPIINRFPEKPLIYNVVWKTTIYFFAAMIVRYLEHLFHFWRKSDSLAAAQKALMAEVVWPHFWAIQLWLVVLFLVYCSLRELSRALGRERVINMFFREPTRPAKTPGESHR